MSIGLRRWEARLAFAAPLILGACGLGEPATIDAADPSLPPHPAQSDAPIEAVRALRSLLPRTLSPSAGSPLRVVPARRAPQTTLLTEPLSGLAVAIAPQQVQDVAAVPADGCSIFSRALRVPSAAGGSQQASLVQCSSAAGFEDYVHFSVAPLHGRMTYSLHLGDRVAALRLVENVLEFLDASGAPRLRVNPPFLVDAQGRRHNAVLHVEDCRVDRNPAAPWGRSLPSPGQSLCSLEVAWDSFDVAYPALLDPAWTLTGPMNARRNASVAIVLPSGQVLMAGGRDLAALASAELFDPASKTWAVTGPMSGARADHAAVLLSNGKVLVAGGRAVDPVSSSELYDPLAGTWAPAAVMGAARAAHRAVRLSTGEVLVVGGESSLGKLASAELYNPAQDSWRAATTMLQPRVGHTLTVLNDGIVLVAGGENSASLATAERYSRTNDNWLPADSMASARSYHAAVTLGNGKVLIAGGRSSGVAIDGVELYDPVVETFKDVAPMGQARFAHTCVLLQNGMVVVAGGLSGAPVGLAEVFDPSAGVWTSAGLLQEARSGQAAVPVSGGRALLAGGSNSAGALGSAELFAFQTTGAACTTTGECESGFCTDGVCCDSACQLPCMACSALVKGQGIDGTCQSVKAGLDPKDDCNVAGTAPCQTPGTCDGYGSCASLTGMQCAPSSCASATEQNNVSLCDASLHCVVSGTTPCSPFLCKSGACGMSCTIADDCIMGSACIGSQCLAPGMNGTTCQSVSECGSGFCVEGICCDFECVGTCSACKASLKSMGIDGTCGPAKYGTPCGATTCVNAQVIGQLCNSTGQCLAQSASCAPYASCDGSSCPTTCTLDAECDPGTFCGNGSCVPLLLTGLPCKGNPQCKTGYCIEGVCCGSSCGGGAMDDCRVCSVALGSTTDGVCGILDGVPCGGGQCSMGICKAVVEAGPDVQDGQAEADAAEEIGEDAAEEAAWEAGPEAEPAWEAGPEPGPEATVPEAAEEPEPAQHEAGQEAGDDRPYVIAGPDSGSDCACRLDRAKTTRPGAWMLLLLAVPWLRKRRR